MLPGNLINVKGNVFSGVYDFFLEMHDLLVKSKALQHGPEMLILLRFTSLYFGMLVF